MPSTFLALQIGYSALQNSTLGIDTTGHNIANAGTAGYARETVDTETANSLPVYTDHQTFIGQGVNGRGQNRIDDPSIDAQFRDNNAQQSYWQTTSSEINSIGQIFNEPSGTTLRDSISSFFSAWNQLSQAPADSGARAAVYQASKAVGDSFQETANALTSNYTRNTSQLTASGAQFNTLLQNVADLNQQIIQATAESTMPGSTAPEASPNNLLDQRDAVLDQLSQYAKIEVTHNVDGSVTVAADLNSGSALGVGPVQLVNGSQVVGQVNTTIPATASTPQSGSTPASVSLKDLLNQGGQLNSLYNLTQYISNSDGKSGVLDKLNALANEFVTQVNTQFESGYGLSGQTGSTNVLFVPTGTTAATVQVNSSLATNLGAFAAATNSTASGQNQTDGGNAQAIAGLMNTYEQSGTGVSYAGIVTQLGIDGQDANQKNQTFTALTTQASQFRQAVSGVDINEEMKNMIQYQQAYGAASKVISVFNDMLTTLINAV